MKWEMIDFNLTLAPNALLRLDGKTIRISKCFAITECDKTNDIIRKRLEEEAKDEWIKTIYEHALKVDSVDIQIYDSKNDSYTDKED